MEISFIVGTYALRGEVAPFTGLYSDYVGRNLLIISDVNLFYSSSNVLIKLRINWWIMCSFFLGLVWHFYIRQLARLLMIIVRIVGEHQQLEFIDFGEIQATLQVRYFLELLLVL